MIERGGAIEEEEDAGLMDDIIKDDELSFFDEAAA